MLNLLNFLAIFTLLIISLVGFSALIIFGGIAIIVKAIKAIEEVFENFDSRNT